MYAVTYEAADLPLLPSVFGAEVYFNGDIDLSGCPDGSWTVETIYVSTATPALRGLMPVMGSAKLAKDSPLYPIIVAAVEAHDRQTHAVTDCVVEETRGAAQAAYANARYQLGKDIARGLELR